ncbi:hypothetical protein PP508_gp29 [Gordonia phage Samman98]|uniref:Uncharacterized protein n=1 Tax=Gordonia phage Samman98 TaxID=2862998 RepID=A0AC61NKB5_9CAUD|nr:hypothetical protein PP508_gp29 [Gordonia phage Samman98]QYC54508.1 hypothetical protein SEA_SAMMAN98_29 [Gordonia phage Samman98]
MAQNLMGASNALPQVLVSQQLASSETTQYTCPSATSVKLATATLTNTSASAVTVSVSVVKSGGTAGSANRVVSAYSLAAGDSIVISELAGVFLGPGDLVSTLAGTASAVALVMTGVVFS